MQGQEARQRFATGQVARLATVRPDGRPHLVPIAFAVDGDTVYTSVDAKPKRSRQLQRLVNLRERPQCGLLVDHYDHDWSRLWWVRADGVADVIERPEPSHAGLALLADRYPQYRAMPPTGPLIVVTVTRWRGWSAA